MIRTSTPFVRMLTVLLVATALAATPAWAGEPTPAAALRKGIEAGIFALVILFAYGIGLCLLLLVQLVFPAITRAGADGLRASLFRSFGLGLLVVALGVGAVALAGALSEALAGLVFVFLASFCGLLGFSAAAEYVGGRVFSSSEQTWSRPAQLAVGWLVWAGASLTPFLGWLVIFPFLGLAGIGAVVRPLWRRNRQTEADTPVATEADTLPMQTRKAPSNDCASG